MKAGVFLLMSLDTFTPLEKKDTLFKRWEKQGEMDSVPHSQICYRVVTEHRISKPENVLVEPSSHSADKETEAWGMVKWLSS